MNKVVKVVLALLGLVICLSAFLALTSCDALTSPSPTPIFEQPTDGRLMRMIVTEDVIIETFSLQATGNVGGTISKGTIIMVKCYQLVCIFPDTTLYVDRDHLEPYEWYNLEGEVNG